MDLALASVRDPSGLLLAYDALLSLAEDRLGIAKVRFEESLSKATNEETEGSGYIANYCQLWLAISDQSVGWEEIRGFAEATNAAWPTAPRIVQVFLPRTPLARLEEICGHRTVQHGTAASTVQAASGTHASVDFRF